MAALRPTLIGGILVILFTFCMFNFMSFFIANNNPTSPIINNTQLAPIVTQINESVSSFQSFANDAQTSLGADQPSSSFLFLMFKSAFYIPLTFLSQVISYFAVMTGLLFPQLFGNGGAAFFLLFAVINGILVITVVLLVIKAIRTGESER